MKRIIIIGISFIVFSSLGYFYYFSEKQDAKPIRVKIVPVQKGKFIASTSAQGKIIAQREQQLTSSRTGTILDFGKSVGSFLPTGSIIAVVKRLKTDLYTKNEQLDYDLLDLEVLKEQVQQSEALLKEKAISRMQLKELKIKQYKQEKRVQDIRKEINDDTVKTTFSGLLVDKFFNTGDRVYAGAKLATIIDTSSLAIKISVGQHQIPSIHIGQRVEYTSPTFADPRYGKVIEIERTADSQNNSSPSGGTEPQFTVLASLSVSSHDNIYLGSIVNAAFILQEKEDAIFIPLEAVLYSNNTTIVYVPSKGVAQARKIKVGLSNDNYIEILKGLNDSDSVITLGNLGIKNGDLITNKR